MGNHTSAPNKRLEASFYAIQSIKALAKHEDRQKKLEMSSNEAKSHKISDVGKLSRVLLEVTPSPKAVRARNPS